MGRCDDVNLEIVNARGRFIQTTCEITEHLRITGAILRQNGIMRLEIQDRAEMRGGGGPVTCAAIHIF